MKYFLQGYLGLSGSYGFYRGWIADYDYRKFDYKKPIKPIKYKLTTHKYSIKLFRGILNAGMYASIGNIFALYRLMCRIEIKLLNKDPYQHIDVYTEIFDSITLEPQKY